MSKVKNTKVSRELIGDRTKKNILVVFTGAMELGGIERSLLGLLDLFDYEKYNVDLFLYAHHGVLFSVINANVNLLPEVKELAFLRESFIEKLKHGCFISAWKRLCDEFRAKRGISVNNDDSWAEIMRKCAPSLSKHYDLALGYFRPFDFLLEKVSADVKIGWIHTDYSKNNAKQLKKVYEKLDFIVAVGEGPKEAFCSNVPELKNKVIVVENVLSETLIRRQAEEDVSKEMPEDGSIKLLTIGRYNRAKNFDNIPDICRQIRQKGFDITWYLIGYGKDEDKIRNRITEAGMEEHIRLLGLKANPYPYIRACDLYVQPSRYEGKCVAVIEAQILHKPVVITNYTTSEMQLKNGYDGIIVPMDNNECAEGICKVLADDAVMKQIVENEKQTDYSNRNEINKIYSLIYQ